MKIFVAYGFTEQNQWIKDLIYPLIIAHGFDVEHGESVQGENVSATVLDKIKKSDALIGFLTKVEQVQGQNYWTTQNWVLQELAAARTSGKAFVEIRDIDLDPNRGMLSDTQPIYFNEAKGKEKLLVELVLVLNKWNNKLKKQLVRLIPEDMARIIYKNRNDQITMCTYRFRTGFNEITIPKEAELEKEVEAVCIKVDGFPDDDDVSIEIKVRTVTGIYTSGWHPVNMLNLQLE